MITPQVLLLGTHNSGKTHYAGQLYGRLLRQPGALTLRPGSTPDDLGPLRDVLRCLENGHAGQHTPTATSHAVRLPLVDQRGREIDLHWPDYGGEQLRHIEADRAVPEHWRARLVAAGSWMLLIRLSAETTYPDALDQLVGQRDHPSAFERAQAQRWDASARWIEFLQILLHVAGHGISDPLSSPRLAVLLSCYDELKEPDGTPRHVLAKHLPLLADFIETNWRPDARSIWGLSALGRLLDKDSNDDGFIDDGPEKHGWVVPPGGGDPHPDLSLPLAWLLGGG